jgi:hypothetical protein
MLYTYCITHDSGSAPNPFWGICTLAICKPTIRRTAKIGDWVVGTGSKEFGFENQVVYAMKITKILSIEDYDNYCRTQRPEKIPVWRTTDPKLRMGDCIYDYSKGEPILRTSVHKEENVKTDLGGENVLLSDHFYYFGSKPIPLPTYLLPIVKQGQGHKSLFNESYEDKFIDWIETFNKHRNKIIASPYGLKNLLAEDYKSKCSKIHLQSDEEDERIENGSF